MVNTTGMTVTEQQAANVTAGVALDPAQNAEALKWLLAARALAFERFPYLSTTLSAMTPVAAPGLGTVAVDARWRMYYDPARILGIGDQYADRQSVDDLISDWIHEAGHLLYDHAGRWSDLHEPAGRHRIYNAAGDARINENNKMMSLAIFPTDITYDVLVAQGYTVDRDWTTERLYLELLEQVQQQAQQNCPVHGPGSDSDTAGSDAGSSGSDSADNADDSSGNAGGTSPENSPSPNTGTGDSSPDGPAGSSGSSNVNCSCWTDQPPDFGSDCGSGSGGGQRPWEQSIDDGQKDGSVDPGRGDLIRDATAKAVREASKSRGDIPGDLARWAEARLSPAVDWRRELRSVVSRHLGMQAGKTDYSYGRLPRRRIPGVVTPGMVQARPPAVAVVIDTSGSMGTEEIDQAVGDLAGLLRAVTGSAVPLRVLSCDSAVGQVQTLTNIKNLSLTGGGGTDMGVGIHAAAALKPRPDVIVTLTDGYTGWPATPDPAAPGALYVAVILNSDQASEVPDFMHAITVEGGVRAA